MTRREEILKKFQEIDDSVINDVINTNKEITNHEWRKLNNNYAKNGFLRFKPELINELAKPFTNPEQMVRYEGKNQNQIRSAGRYISFKEVARPKWFDEIYVGESLEECLEVVLKYNDYSIFKTENKRIYQRLYWYLGEEELKNKIKEINPEMEIRGIYPDDDVIFEILSQYKDSREVKKSPHKKYLMVMWRDQGENYPKSYKLYKSMQIDIKDIERPKRGNYEQRVPPIEKCDLEGNLLQVFSNWSEVEAAGFKRSSVAGAIRGSDGHHRHKKFIWRHV